MRVLLVHRSLPGHYRHVAAALAADPRNQVVFASCEAGSLPGIDVRTFTPHRGPSPQVHPYVKPYEDAVLHGQAMYRLCRRLQIEGFVPDLVCAHAGWGPGLYLKEAFPDTPLLTYFEWFYRTRGGDADFLDGPLHPDDACRIQSRNAGILQELAASDWGVCPTTFQRDQFPTGFRDKMTILHDGVDTGYFTPAPGTPMVLPGLDLSGAEEIVTYATRGMEPYRGFPQFMRAAALLLERRPRLRIVVGGADEVVYGRPPANGSSYKDELLRELAGRDLSRLHFAGPLPEPQWRQLLRASTVHVYLTIPFVLSWSLIEAMATGCAIVASDTAPVREVADDGRHALLADIRSPEAIAGRIEEALDDAALRRALGAAARQQATDRYALADLLPRHLRLMANLAESGRHRRSTETQNEFRSTIDVKSIA